MNNEPNKPTELTEKELEGIVGGESMVTELKVCRLQQDAYAAGCVAAGVAEGAAASGDCHIEFAF